MFRAPWQKWSPIKDLPTNWESWMTPEFNLVRDEWLNFRKSAPKEKLALALARVNRHHGLETGQLEGLYTVPRGLTEMIIDYGVETVNLSHIDTQKEISTEKAKGLIKDQTDIVQLLLDMVRSGEPLTIFDLRSMHALLTENQDLASGLAPTGERVGIPLLKGQFKIRPNNPRRPDGLRHEYCPPEFVIDELERLLAWHETHKTQGIDPVTEAAWFHHRFVQIHPFQDGNGRMGRTLANYMLLEADLPPLVIPISERDSYIDALERAEAGDLADLVYFFQDRIMREMRALVRLESRLDHAATIEIPNGGPERGNTEAFLGWLTDSALK